MTQEGFKKCHLDKKEKKSESKPEMCGWLLLKMAEDRKLKRQEELQKSLKKD